MDVILISVKGDLKPTALRHQIFEMGNMLGIRGFLNYRMDMYELLIHAEGENNVIMEFTSQIKQLAKVYRLMCSIESAIPGSFPDFKIAPINTNSDEISKDNNKRSNPDSMEIPYRNNLRTEQQQPLTYEKSRISGFRKLSSFIKQAGLW
ncbi:MAG: hypothetical protein RBS07_02505 [Lentimicrobium sp.]|jgi:hypothetical protein|nr:hypothetical protein [Lentimicrobium sp.]